MTRILAISGSLRRGSHNTALLRSVIAHKPADVEIELLDPARLAALPAYNEDDDTDTPPAVATELREQIRAADALLIATPEYNGSIPGQLKNLVDWGSRPRGNAPLFAKPVGVISSSMSDYGALWGGAELKKSLGIAGARVVEEIDLAVGGVHNKLDGELAVADEELLGRLTDVVKRLADAHRALVG